MKLKMLGRRRFALRPWQRVRKPAGVLKLPSPAKRKTRRKVLSDRERFLKACRRALRDNAEANRILAKM